jgi:hypothetical protein
LRMLWLILGEDWQSCGEHGGKGEPCKVNRAVHGPLESLASLRHLGEECTTVPVIFLEGSHCFFLMGSETATGSPALALQGTNAYGSAASLRAIPRLGSDWGPAHTKAALPSPSPLAQPSRNATSSVSS